VIGERLSAVIKGSAWAQVEGTANSRAEWGTCARAAVLQPDLRLAENRQVHRSTARRSPPRASIATVESVLEPCTTPGRRSMLTLTMLPRAAHDRRLAEIDL